MRSDAAGGGALRVSRAARWKPLLPALAWMALIFVLSSQSHVPRTPGISIRYTTILGHLALYGVLAALLYAGLPLQLGRGRRAAIAFVVAVLYGVSDEYHQSFVPGRDADPFDLLVDTLAAALSLTLFAALLPRLARRSR